jgi:hypothetical protein
MQTTKHFSHLKNDALLQVVILLTTFKTVQKYITLIYFTKSV